MDTNSRHYFDRAFTFRHMRDDHGVKSYTKADDVWYACMPCGRFTTDLDSHNEQHHHRLQEIPSDSMVTVRLLLCSPSQSTLVSQFRADITVAAVLTTHLQEIREELGDLGPGEEVTITCGETLLLPDQLHTTLLSSLDHWNWAGEQEIHLEYDIRPSSLHLGEEAQDNDELDIYVERLLKTNSLGEETLKEAAASMNLDREAHCSGASQLHQEMLIATKHPDNPFHHSKFPFDVNQSYYSMAIQFARVHLPKNYHQILELRNFGHQYDVRDVIPTVQILAHLMRLTSPVNSALPAMKSVFLKSSGLTNNGLDATQRSGFSQGAR